jgi:hypothetical protein
MNLKIIKFNIMFFLLIGAFNVNAKLNEDIIKINTDNLFNKEQLVLSGTYRKLYVEDDKIGFVNKFSKGTTTHAEKQKFLLNNYINTCRDIYYGRKIFNKNEREGSVCLKLHTLGGYGKAAYYLSSIAYKSKKKNEAVLFLGIAQGLGYTKFDTKYKNKLKSIKNYKELVKLGAKISANFDILNKNSIHVGKQGLSFFENKIIDPKYYDFNDDENINIRNTYNLLKNNNFKGFIKKMSEQEINGKKILLLAGAKANDIPKLIKYCSSLENQYLGMYCISKIYDVYNSNKSIFSYTLKKYNQYTSSYNEKYLFETLILIGLQDENRVINRLLTNIISNHSKDNEDKLSKLLSYYNKGRILKHKV